MYLGVVCLIAVIDGKLCHGDKIVSSYAKTKYDIAEVGYIICNMKSVSEAHVGDTFYHLNKPVEPLPGFVPAKPMVFAGIFPADVSDFNRLDESLKKLILNDSSVSIQKETSAALGQGWRLGFLGTLHLDVFRQRLEEEYDANVIVTHPTVPYKIVYKNGDEKILQTPADFPSPQDMANKVKSTQEPSVLATMIFPEEYLGSLLELCSSRRGELKGYNFIDETRVMLTCKLPAAEVVTDFYDHLKSRSSGFASFDYEDAGYEESDLIKMEVLLNTQPVDALAAVMHRSQVETVGRDLAKRLKNVIKRQLFEIIIQTAANGKVIARETVKALRKNVTAKCYGGDITRKMKLLNKQKEGKKRMKMIGRVELPQEAFL
ncbi:Translation factor guf1 mitochondrial, partial [Spiromyces aspiralis]